MRKVPPALKELVAVGILVDDVLVLPAKEPSVNDKHLARAELFMTFIVSFIFVEIGANESEGEIAMFIICCGFITIFCELAFVSDT